MLLSRRRWLQLSAAGFFSQGLASWASAADLARGTPLKITGLKVTPIALPDPPILASSGCHGPYFLRNVVELQTDAGIVGIGETRGGQKATAVLEKLLPLIKGQNVFAYRSFAKQI